MSDRTEDAGFSTGVTGSLTNANPQAQTWLSIFAALYKSLAPLYDPDKALLRDPDAWNKLMLDGVVRSAVNTYLAKVVRQTWAIDPGDESPEAAEVAKIVEANLRGSLRFNQGRRHLAKGKFWGYSPVWISGQREWRSLGGHVGNWWCLSELQPMDKRQIILVPKNVRGADGKDHVSVEVWVGTVNSGVHVPLEHSECLAIAKWEDEPERKGYGRGLMETLWAIIWIKQMILRLGLSGFEKWCEGVIDAAIDATAHASPDMTSDDAAAAAMASLRALRSNGVYVHDKRDTITLVQPPATGQDATHKWLAYLDSVTTRLILGSLMPSGGGGDVGATGARAGEEGKNTDDLLDGDRELTDEVITDRVVRLVYDLNLPQFAELGYAGAARPKFRSVADENEDPEKVGKIIEQAQKIGLTVGEMEARRRMGLSKPADGEVILEAPKPEPQMGGFGGGFPSFGGDPKQGEGPDGDFRPFAAMLSWWDKLRGKNRNAA